MISIYMILTALATLVLGKGAVECSFSESTGGQQCLGAVGQLLLFHLPNALGTYIVLKKDNKGLILRVKNQTATLYEEYANQSERFTGGTLNLGDAMKRHSGDYVLEEFKSNGLLLKKIHVHLEIQAPVSEPAVSQTCLSPEQMTVSCSSEGDGVEFTLTVNGQLLKHTRDHSLSPSNWTTNTQSLTGSTAKEDKSGASNVTISLHGSLTGNLTCNVQNNVSREETVIHLKSCKVLTFQLVAVVVRAVVITLLLFTLCLGIFHLLKKTRPMTVNEGISKAAILCSTVTNPA